MLRLQSGSTRSRVVSRRGKGKAGVPTASYVDVSADQCRIEFKSAGNFNRKFHEFKFGVEHDNDYNVRLFRCIP